MKQHRSHFATSFLAALGIGAVAAAGCSRTEAPAQNAPAQGSSTAAAATVPVSSLPKIDQGAILQHIKVLSADDYEGRAPGTAGEDKTVEYLTSQFKQLGLQPGNTDGTYTQAVPLVAYS